jgi:hypothetical protein
MLDNPKFAELLIASLKKQGYDCEHENGEIKVSKNGFSIADIKDETTYCVYRNTLNDSEYYNVRAIHESLTEAFRLYEQGEPVAAQPQYRKLCEFGNYLIAAKLMNYGYMEFVTWQQDAEKTRVDVGHYLTDYAAAKEDFALRCGLVDKNRMFDETEMKLIRQGLVHLGADFPDLTAEQMTLLGKVVERIEMLVPEIREHEELEHGELAPDDGLEV